MISALFCVQLKRIELNLYWFVWFFSIFPFKFEHFIRQYVNVSSIRSNDRVVYSKKKAENEIQLTVDEKSLAVLNFIHVRAV